MPEDFVLTVPLVAAFVVLVAVVQFVLGVAIGLFLSRRSSGRHARPEFGGGRIVDLLEELRMLAKVIASDLGRHYQTIGSIEGELATVTKAAPNADYDSMGRMVSKILAANADLQVRLSETELKLRSQSDEIQRYIAEARTDSLTGLLNRRAFDDELARRLAEWRRRGTPVSLVLIDADNFKHINDRHGHLAGDEALRSLAGLLRCLTREMDVVARFGGEEFALILPDTPIGVAMRVAARVQQEVRKVAVENNDTPFYFTVSSGLAQAAISDDVEGLIARVDVALYHAKHGGRDCAFMHDGSVYRRVPEDANTEPDAELRDICADLRREITETVRRADEN